MSTRVNTEQFTDAENKFLSSLAEKYHYLYKGKDNSVWVMPEKYDFSGMVNITDLCSSFDSINCDTCIKFSKSKPVLDEIEKKYLKNIIYPFRDKIIKIVKHKENDDYSRICIDYHSYNFVFGWEEINTIELPEFKSNSMYIGLTPNEEYTLEELEI